MKTLLVPLCALAPLVLDPVSPVPVSPDSVSPDSISREPGVSEPGAVTSAHQALRRVLESLPDLAPGRVDFAEVQSRLVDRGDGSHAVVRFETLQVQGIDALVATRAFTEWMVALGSRPGCLEARHQATVELEKGGIVAHDVEILLAVRPADPGPAADDPEFVLRSQARRADAAVGPLEIHRKRKQGRLYLEVVPMRSDRRALAQVTGFLAAVDATFLSVVDCGLWRRDGSWTFRASVSAVD